MAIFFQGNSGPQGGVSACDVYSYGFTSSCLDPNTGLNRGFTQEWYYDETVGGWIAVSVAGGTGTFNAENAGPTYDSVLHSAPTNPSGSGNIRKFAFLDPDTGSLTFDFVNSFDILNPSEKTFDVTSFAFVGMQQGQAGTVRSSSLGPEPLSSNDGVTLCSDGSVVQEISTDESTAGIRFIINTSNPSPFSITPTEAKISLNAGSGVSILGFAQGDGSPSLDFPLSITAGSSPGITNGTNNVARSKAYIGFTANGPVTNALSLTIAATGSDSSIDTATAQGRLSTENNYYVAVVPLSIADPITGITAGTFTSRADGNTNGYKFLMNPMGTTTAPNTKTKREFSKSQLGPIEGDQEFRLCVAFPTRSQVDAGGHLFFDPGTSSSPLGPGGFAFTAVDGATLNITNEYSYTEEYTVLKAQQLGISDNGFKIDTSQ